MFERKIMKLTNPTYIALSGIAAFLLLISSQSLYSGDDKQESNLLNVYDTLTQSVSRFYSEGNYRKVLELTEQIDSVSVSPKLLFFRGMSYGALYNYPKAQNCFQKLIQEESTNVNYRFQFGRLLIQSGFTDEAIVQLKTCIELDSSYLPASFQLGVIYNLRKKDPEKEIEIFSFLIRQNPEDFLSLYYKGDALKRFGLADSGIEFIQKSVELNPRYFPSIIAFANYINSKKDYTGALDLYQKAGAMRPNDEDVVFQIGECYRKLGQLNEAVTQFKNAILLDSLNALYYAQLGYAYFSLGAYDSSIAAYNKAIFFDENNVQYYRNLALVFQKMDSTEGVVKSYQRGIKALHPEEISHVYNDLAAYYLGKNRWREAAEAYQQVTIFNPENESALYWAGHSYMQVSEKKSAIAAFEKYLKLTEGDTSKVNFRRYVKQSIETLRRK